MRHLLDLLRTFVDWLCWRDEEDEYSFGDFFKKDTEQWENKKYGKYHKD